MTFYLNIIDFSVSKNAIFVVISFNYSQKDALFCWYWHTVSGEQTTICYFTSTTLWFSFLRLPDIERILLGRHQNVEIIPDRQSDKRTYWIRTTGDQNSSFRLSAQKRIKVYMKTLYRCMTWHINYWYIAEFYAYENQIWSWHTSKVFWSAVHRSNFATATVWFVLFEWIQRIRNIRSTRNTSNSYKRQKKYRYMSI